MYAGYDTLVDSDCHDSNSHDFDQPSGMPDDLSTLADPPAGPTPPSSRNTSCNRYEIVKNCLVVGIADTYARKAVHIYSLQALTHLRIACYRKCLNRHFQMVPATFQIVSITIYEACFRECLFLLIHLLHQTGQ